MFCHGVQRPQYLCFQCRRTAEHCPEMWCCCCWYRRWGWRHGRDENWTELRNTCRLLAAWLWGFVFHAAHVWLHCLDSHRAEFEAFFAQRTPCLVDIAWYRFQPCGKILVGQPVLVKLALSHVVQGKVSEWYISALKVPAATTSLFCWFRYCDCVMLLREAFGKLFKKINVTNYFAIWD